MIGLHMDATYFHEAVLDANRLAANSRVWMNLYAYAIC